MSTFSSRSSKDVIGVREVYESIGSLLVRWSSVERALQKSIRELNKSTSVGNVHGIGRTLACWKEQHLEVANERADHVTFIMATFCSLSNALEVRNHICHGTLALHGSETGDREDVQIVTEMNGVERNISIDELMSTTAFLDRIFRLMDDITWLAKQPGSTALEKEYSRIRA